MARRFLVGVWLVALSAAAGAQSPASKANVPRTPWGSPDLQGVWSYWTFTPLERPKEFADRPVLSGDEAARFAERASKQAVDGDSAPARAGDPGAYSQEVWTDRTRATASTRTSIIVDPPDGRLPPQSPEWLKQAALEKSTPGSPVRIRTGGMGSDDPEARGIAERCLLGFSTGPPMLPGGYNNNIQLVQTPTHVVIVLEMNHDARIIPFEPKAQLPDHMRQWLGDSRARWEGTTLVVETRNFTNKTGSISLTGFTVGSAEKMTLIEKFSRTDAGTLEYEFTVNDPLTFTRPVTGKLTMTLSDEPMYEYACHEGNYAMPNMLRGARADEKKK